MPDFLTYGEVHSEIRLEVLVSTAAQQTFHLVTGKNQHDFELVELRYVSIDDNTIADVIVVDCVNDQVPTRNSVGILNRERLALIFPKDQSLMPGVRALRADFPKTLHQNHVNAGEPSSICLHFEPWAAVKRTWTPQKHLHRILWWLAETAKDTLHRKDQPVEQLYFDSSVKVILPPKFSEFLDKDDFVLTVSRIDSGSTESKFTPLVGQFLSKKDAYKNGDPHYVPIMLSLPSITHGNIEIFPETLGHLETQLLARGSTIFEPLCNEIKRLTPQEGLSQDTDGRILLIFYIPIKRAKDGPAEENKLYAFLMLNDFSILGESLGVLHKHESKYFVLSIIGGTSNGSFADSSGQWRQLPILPVEIKTQATIELARNASGVNNETADFNAILAGVGALGGVLADLWSREAWGTWTLIDPDQLEPHNIIRHIAKNGFVGINKAVVTKFLLEANFSEGYNQVEAIPKSILETDSPKIQQAIASANFFVDATTTLYVPRDLSQINDFPRSASVFLSPSGLESVLLLEDDARQIRLESLEAQYYRAIINSEWGEKHLTGHFGNLWVGAGCRDISAIISFELVQLHSSIIARQMRAVKDQSEPRICVWQNDSLTGGVDVQVIPVAESISENCGEWRVLWDKDIQRILQEFRVQKLPNETGGVILGYFDQKLKTIFVVDVLNSPLDSKSTPSEFVRGIYGLETKLSEIAQKTANIVGYIGEWHSHPSCYSAQPSSIDYQLIQTLAETLSQDGDPALMMIVAKGEISITVK